MLNASWGQRQHARVARGPEPALFWDFEHMGTLPTELAVERTGLAGMWQDDGTLGFGPHNLLLQSDDLSSATWTKTRVAASGSSTIVEDGTTGAHRVEQGIGTVPANTAATYRCQVKRGVGARQFAMQVVASGGADYFTVFFDLAAGTVGAVSVVGTAAVASSAIVATDDGYWRVTIVATVSTTAVLASVRCEMSSGTTAGSDSYAGDGVSSLQVRRIQVNIGTAASEHIATTTAARYLMRFEKHPLASARGLQTEMSRSQILTNPALAYSGTTPTGWTVLLGTGTRTPVASGLGGGDGAVAFRYTTTGGTQRVVLAQDIALSSNGSYSYSLQIEQVHSLGGLTYGEVLNVTSVPSGCNLAWFLNGAPVVSSSPVTVGRLTITLSGTYTGATATFRMGCGTASAVDGDVTTSRPNLENDVFPTSWINGSSRAADTVSSSLPTAARTALASQGSIVVDVTVPYFNDSDAASINALGGLWSASDANYIRIYRYSNRIGVSIRTAATTVADRYVGGFSAWSRHRVAITWGPGGVNIAVDGVLATRLAAVSIPSTTDIGFNLFVGSACICHRARIFTSEQTDAELQALTAA